MPVPKDPHRGRVTARYDAIAADYAGRPDDYSGAATRALLDLVGVVGGLRLLDLACGHGPITRELARRGAQVVGVDLSAELVRWAAAREGEEHLGVRFVCADAGDPELLAGEVFDGVVCHFGLSDVDDLEPLLRNVSRWSKAGGWFAFCILHPCFPGAEGVSASWPADAGYYDEGWWRADGERSTLRRRVGATHRMLSTYLNALVGAGLSIEEVREPPPDEDWCRGRPGAASVPVYLVVRARTPR